ncbi:hypothetical protein OKW30_000774 [Paraburkholderia sp. Clong3]|uniref:hypothetical protein n=1 Tax=Paraburkholderia sp. Clong3 TaxID=2991061 RepID=UPI003D1FCFEA
MSNIPTHSDGFTATAGYEAMCSVIDRRIAQFATAIHDELHRPVPDTQRIELLELQQAELRCPLDATGPNDRRAIERHVAHFGSTVSHIRRRTAA